MAVLLPKLKRVLLRRYMSGLCRSGADDAHWSGDLSRIKRIALWQFGGVGDMLLATPVVRALSQVCPDAKIHIWCSSPVAAAFLSRFPQVETIHAFPVYDFDSRTLLRSSVRQSLGKELEGMRRFAPEMLINLHVPALLDWWAVEWWLVSHLQDCLSMGFDPRFIRHGSVYHHSLNAAERDGVHYTTFYRRLLEEAGIPCDTHTQFPLSDADRQTAAGLLAEYGGAEMRYVCMHIGGNRLKLEGKMWPVERFAELAARLWKSGMTPVLIGVQDEQPMAEWLCGEVPGCVDLTGRTQIGEMAALIAMADGFIGHDSGPFHVAAAVGTPCVAICGRPDAEDEYLKYDRKGVVAVRGDDPSMIGVDEVYAYVAETFADGGER